MKKMLLCMIFSSGMVAAKTPGIEYGLHFNSMGQIIKPDEVFLNRGSNNHKEGDHKDALKNFKISASYGNAWAKYFLGLINLQDKNYIEAHAWLNLLDSDFRDHDKVNTYIQTIEKVLEQGDIEKAKIRYQELKETYGNYAALMKREKWRKSHKYTGTNIKGNVPIGLRIELDNGQFVTGTDIRNQVEDFVYEYDHQFKVGNVKLQETEYIDGEEATEDVEQ